MDRTPLEVHNVAWDRLKAPIHDDKIRVRHGDRVVPSSVCLLHIETVLAFMLAKVPRAAKYRLAQQHRARALGAPCLRHACRVHAQDGPFAILAANPLTVIETMLTD